MKPDHFLSSLEIYNNYLDVAITFDWSRFVQSIVLRFLSVSIYRNNSIEKSR